MVPFTETYAVSQFELQAISRIILSSKCFESTLTILDSFKTKLGVEKVISAYWHIISTSNLEVDKFSSGPRGGISIGDVKSSKFSLGNNSGL